jgi:predicted MFS family arabinose efflux permease
MFLGMAAMLALTVLPVLWLQTPATDTGGGTRPDWRALAGGWWLRLRQPGVPAFIALICIYKFGNSMGSSLVGPYMYDVGMSKEQIALIKGTLGSAATLAGAAVGGWLAWRAGRRTALLVAGLLEAGALALYAFAAVGADDHALVVTACIAEHLLGGMAVVALFTLMMDASDPTHASTDYTVLSCALVLGHGAAAVAGALLADHAGYAALFVIATVASAAGCLWLVCAIDRGAGPQRLATVWPRHPGRTA